MDKAENQIVVYQPNETVRLDVRLENETVWLTQSQMGELFGCTTRNVRMHLDNIYSCGELFPEGTRKDFFLVRIEGSRQVRRTVTCYNLDAIISVGYRVNSILGVKFRQWATGVLKEYLLRGYSMNARLNQIEDKMDRRFAQHDQAIVDLKEKVDLLDLFAKKRQGVKVTVFTSEHYDKKHVSHHKISDVDIKTFNAQYPRLTVRYNECFHDRFLIIDDKELYLIGASLKDLGRKCFGFTKMDSAEIRRIKKLAFTP